MPRSLLLCSATLVCGFVSSLLSQETEKAKSCSVQIVNATSVDSIEMTINGIKPYPNFPQGAQTKGGNFQFLDWKFQVKDCLSGESIGKKVNIDDGKSYTIVLVGDFKRIELAPGQNGVPAKTEVNARVLVLSNDLKKDTDRWRVRVMNGIYGQPIVFHVDDGAISEIPPMQYQEYKALPESFVGHARIGEKLFELPAQILPPKRNFTIIFYEQAGEPKYVVVNEDTPSSLRQEVE